MGAGLDSDALGTFFRHRRRRPRPLENTLRLWSPMLEFVSSMLELVPQTASALRGSDDVSVSGSI